MTSQQTDLTARIAASKQNVEQAKQRTAESRNRSSSEASGISGHERKASGDGNRNLGNPGVESNEGAGGTRSTGGSDTNSQTRPELGPVNEESSDEEEAEGGQSAPARASPTSSTVSRSNVAGSRPNAPNPTPSTQAQTGSGKGKSKNIEIPEMDTDLTSEQRRLLEELVDINGQDSYDALAAGIGKLKRDEYLALPEGFRIANVPAEMVGRPDAHSHLNVRTWAQIYALNKARAPEGADAMIFGMLRLEAVKCGWLDSQREIVFLRPVANAMRTLADDMAQIRDRVGTIKTASFLVPLIAEHVFRTFGHHFISSDSANYTERYNSTMRSCLAPEAIGLLPPAVYFHAALHWVSPGRAWRVLKSQLSSQQIPDALRIRVNAAPAGTAILTTTAAIVESMAAVGLEGLFAKHGNFDLRTIRAITALVKENPVKFHKSYFAYQVPAPTAEELAQLESAKQEAIRFSPFAQAYINTYMKDAALGKAQALKKHAEQNPVQMRRAQNLFRAIVRKDVTTVEDLFASQVAAGDFDV